MEEVKFELSVEERSKSPLGGWCGWWSGREQDKVQKWKDIFVAQQGVVRMKPGKSGR